MIYIVKKILQKAAWACVPEAKSKRPRYANLELCKRKFANKPAQCLLAKNRQKPQFGHWPYFKKRGFKARTPKVSPPMAKNWDNLEAVLIKLKGKC